ncbi:MAG: response regulator receiver protein, partial [Devosia sp.]|nr:response regulator receiver protein [Devosia sp.]
NLKTVLVVEDDFLIAMDLKAALIRCGCQTVEMVGSVSGGVERIALGGIDFVTVDIRLRDRDCSPLTQALTSQQIPFMYVSGLAGPDNPDIPSAPWVTKPASDDELRLAAISACTAARRPFH